MRERERERERDELLWSLEMRERKSGLSLISNRISHRPLISWNSAKYEQECVGISL